MQLGIFSLTSDGLGWRTGGIAMICAVHVLASASNCDAQTVQTQQAVNSTASHDIIMRARVAPSCRMTNMAQQIVLSGVTDSGETISTSVSGQGGFTVDCNTPYAVGLQRSTFYSVPRGDASGPQVSAPRYTKTAMRGAVAIPEAAQAAFDAARTPVEERALAQGSDLEVVVKVAGIEGQLESRCIMAEAASSGFICNALAGPDDMRQPAPRTTASVIVTGATEQPGDAFNAQMSAGGLDQRILPDTNAAASAAIDAAERSLIERAVARSGRVRTVDRLTVSLSARH